MVGLVDDDIDDVIYRDAANEVALLIDNCDRDKVISFEYVRNLDRGSVAGTPANR